MQPIPPEVWADFERRLDQMRVPASQRPDYHKWVRFYLDFCHQYGHPADLPSSCDPFLAKLASKNQSEAQRTQRGGAATELREAFWTAAVLCRFCRGLSKAAEDCRSPKRFAAFRRPKSFAACGQYWVLQCRHPRPLGCFSNPARLPGPPAPPPRQRRLALHVRRL